MEAADGRTVRLDSETLVRPCCRGTAVFSESPIVALLLDHLRSLRATYWFIPTIMAFAAILLSFFTLALDAWVGQGWKTDSVWMYTYKPEGARAVLATVAGSMITVAGVTFSMTIAAVSYAAGSIGPRLMSNFMRDRGNQITLGVFIATFIYCLLILRAVRTGGAQDAGAGVDAFVPQISLSITLILTMASVGVLIYFIHHVPESINVSNITARVGRELVSMVDDLFPEHLGSAAKNVDSRPAVGTAEPHGLPEGFDEMAAPIRANRSGYLREIDEKGLMKLACDEDVILRIDRRPGDFISAGQVLIRVWPPDRLDPPAEPPTRRASVEKAEDTDEEREDDTDRDASDVSRVTDMVEGLTGWHGNEGELAVRCRTLFATGNERSHHQNLLFLIDELVEIAARAVSPGINDPFTAMTAIDWLQSGLLTLGRRADLSRYRYDDPDEPCTGDPTRTPAPLRIVVRPVTFGTALACCFDQLTPYAAADRNAALRLMGLARELAESLDEPTRRASVMHHARLLKEAVEQSLTLTEDRATLARAYAEVEAANGAAKVRTQSPG